MLTKIVIRGSALSGALALTPEFFRVKVLPETKDKTRHACVRLIGHPVFQNWIIVHSVQRGKRGMREFSIGKLLVAIPEKQLALFEGKLLGLDFVAGKRDVGFLKAV